MFQEDFPAWIKRHSDKLGLEGLTVWRESEFLVIEANGLEPMLQALALGCSLGPGSVLVETYDVRISNQP